MSGPLRIAVANWTSRMAGGAERYMRDTIGEMRRLGHEVALLHEVDEPGAREPAFAEGMITWSAAKGQRIATEQLRRWSPHAVVVHGLLSPRLEALVQRIAPSVLVAHSYYGTCVSGEKTWKSVPTPCSRPLGPGCLVHYYPHRCGGLDPLVMLRQYRLQRRRNQLLRNYQAVVALSRHMHAEMQRAGARCHFVPIVGPGTSAVPVPAREEGQPWRLLFVGRMTELKGGNLLLDAADLLVRTGTKMEIVFAGEGPHRERWERRAAEIARPGELAVRFCGWLSEDALEREWRSADLFVFPSIWPEPLGLVGVEASRHGLPAVAFDAGGVREWLQDGVNGHLAGGDHASASALAAAIGRCIATPAEYDSLRRNAAGNSLALQVGEHTATLLHLLRGTITARGDAA
jgi:glycosyltransferase involved in cell wall biosynthesis